MIDICGEHCVGSLIEDGFCTKSWPIKPAAQVMRNFMTKYKRLSFKTDVEFEEYVLVPPVLPRRDDELITLFAER